MIKKINNQIEAITKLFIKNGDSIDQNHSIRNEQKIYWEGFTDISYVLKEEKKYETVYEEMRSERDYNILCLDGAIFQFMYEFDKRGKKIITQRLAYFPNINTEVLEDDDEYAEKHYNSLSLFSDIYNKRSIVCPIRFDFDNDISKYKERNHYYSHCTLANYKNCRMPVAGPITPYRFMDFILKNFYNELYKKDYKTKFECPIRMKNLLTTTEKQDLHFSFENVLLKIDNSKLK